MKKFFLITAAPPVYLATTAPLPKQAAGLFCLWVKG